MEATKVLKDEHRVVERFVDTLEAGALHLGAGGPMRPGFFLEAADFMQGFADRCHHAKEEGVLFPALEAAGVPKASGPVTVMLADHREARRLTTEMRSAAEKLEKGDESAREAVARNAQAYVDLLREHIMKEDGVLFPVADRLFTVEQQVRVIEQFERVEKQETGEDGHQGYVQLAEKLALEAKIIPAAKHKPAPPSPAASTAEVSAILAKRSANRQRLEQEAPDLFEGYNELMKRCYKHGALDRKSKELMAVTASVATRCVPCLANHANHAVAAGATRAEVLEAAAIGVEFGGGPSFVIVRDNLLVFLDEIEAGH